MVGHGKISQIADFCGLDGLSSRRGSRPRQTLEWKTVAVVRLRQVRSASQELVNDVEWSQIYPAWCQDCLFCFFHCSFSFRSFFLALVPSSVHFAYGCIWAQMKRLLEHFVDSWWVSPLGPMAPSRAPSRTGGTTWQREPPPYLSVYWSTNLIEAG